MSVFKQRDKYRAQVFIEGVRVASKGGFERRKDAQAWHDATVVALREKPDGQVTEGVTFEDLCRHFEQWHLPHVRAATQRRYKNDLRHMREFFKYCQLKAITPALLERFKGELSKKLAPKTVNDCLEVLRMLLARAVKWRMLAESPYALEALPVPVTRYEWWDEREHLERFMAAARQSRYHAFWLLALETGMRLGEIAGLCKADVDFESGTIHVHRQWVFEAYAFGPPKHNRERWVSFDPKGELARALRLETERSEHDELVFTTSTGKPVQKSKVAGKLFKAAIRRAKIPDLKFHGLRHTFASWYMRERDDVWALKSILGHSDIRTTMRYAHHSKKDRHAPLNLLEKSSHTNHTRGNGCDSYLAVSEERKAGGVTQTRTVVPLVRQVPDAS